MKTRRQRKGGTRGSGVMSISRAVVGNLANGGGRLAQFNIILNNVKDWRKFKRMLVLMGGDKLEDSKWKGLHLEPDDKTPDPADKAGAPAAPAAATPSPVVTDTNKVGGTRKNKRNRI